jgi:flagellar biosynthetic protein FlhB
MAADSDLERAELPSQRRLDQTREKGQVMRSSELSSFTILLAGGPMLWFMGASLTRHMMESLRVGLTLDKELAFNTYLIIIPINSKST